MTYDIDFIAYDIYHILKYCIHTVLRLGAGVGMLFKVIEGIFVACTRNILFFFSLFHKKLDFNRFKI